MTKDQVKALFKAYDEGLSDGQNQMAKASRNQYNTDDEYTAYCNGYIDGRAQLPL